MAQSKGKPRQSGRSQTVNFRGMKQIKEFATPFEVIIDRQTGEITERGVHDVQEAMKRYDKESGQTNHDQSSGTNAKQGSSKRE